MFKKISVLSLSLLVFSACHHPKVPMDLTVTASLDRTDAKVNYDVPVDICIQLDFTDQGRARQHKQCSPAVAIDAQKNQYRVQFNSTLIFERGGWSDAALDSADFQSVTVSLVSHLGRIPFKTRARPVFSLAQMPFSGSIQYECKMDVIASDLIADLEKDLTRQVDSLPEVKDQIIGRHIEEHAKGLDVESLAQLCTAFSKRHSPDADSNGNHPEIANPVMQRALVIYTAVNSPLSAADLIQLEQIAHFQSIIQAIHQEIQARR